MGDRQLGPLFADDPQEPENAEEARRRHTRAAVASAWRVWDRERDPDAHVAPEVLTAPLPPGWRFAPDGHPERWLWWYTPRRGAATQNRNVIRGLHPMGFALRPGCAERCGTCRHLTRHGRSGNRWFKCARFEGARRRRSGAAFDVRLKWGACEHYTGATND